jgi:arylsulfatase A-like enzyme
MPGPPETEVGYGRNWANVSNTPFREYKHWVHEGGIATPLIAHWPAGIQLEGPAYRETEQGPLHDAPTHLIDILATAIDLGGAEYPSEKDRILIKPLEGVSLKPALSGKQLQREAPIYFEHEGNRAVRDGKWKLVAKGVRGAWELYDMEKDRTEMNNLIEDQPEIADANDRTIRRLGRTRRRSFPSDRGKRNAVQRMYSSSNQETPSPGRIPPPLPTAPSRSSPKSRAFPPKE